MTATHAIATMSPAPNSLGLFVEPCYAWLNREVFYHSKLLGHNDRVTWLLVKELGHD